MNNLRTKWASVWIGVYYNGVFAGEITYINNQFEKYMFKFDEDYICEDDIDCVELILV